MQETTRKVGILCIVFVLAICGEALARQVRQDRTKRGLQNQTRFRQVKEQIAQPNACIHTRVNDGYLSSLIVPVSARREGVRRGPVDAERIAKGFLEESAGLLHEDNPRMQYATPQKHTFKGHTFVRYPSRGIRLYATH